jgi:hypothetical protein
MPAKTRVSRAALCGTVAALAAGCNADRLTVPNQNQPSIEGAAADVGSLQFSVTGVLSSDRNTHDLYVRDVGVFGRENYNYTPTEARNTTGILRDFSDPAGFGVGLWAGRYTVLRNIFNTNAIVESSAALTTQQKSASQGFLRTWEALQLLYLINTRHNLGIPVQVLADPSAIAPFVSRDSAYSAITGKLNEGATLLAAGGSAFPFTLTSGFSGFTTPTTFARVNRAFAARVYAYRGSLCLFAPAPSTTCSAATATGHYQAALTALAASFIAPGGALTTGVYSVHSAAAGDDANSITSFGGAARVVVAHPSLTALGTDTLRKADGTPDNRYTAKTQALTPAVNAPGTGNGIATSLGFRLYPAQDSPIAIIKNEELILLRAEARYFTGDVAGALADINEIRTRSGGLAAITAANIATQAQFITELLAQRRLSLLLEGHRWVDVRRFGRLSSLPRDLANHLVAEQMIVPQQECLNRKNANDPTLAGPGCA